MLTSVIKWLSLTFLSLLIALVAVGCGDGAKPPGRKHTQTKRITQVVQEYSKQDAMIAYASRTQQNIHWLRTRCDSWQDSEKFVHCVIAGSKNGVTIYASGYCPDVLTPGIPCRHRGARSAPEDLLVQAVHQMSPHIEVFGVACDMRGHAEQVVCEFAGFDHEHSLEVVNMTICPRLPNSSNECAQFPEPKE